MPGAALIASNMLDRRAGMALSSSKPNRVAKPGFRASIRDPAPSTFTDWATPATFRTGANSMVPPAPIVMSSSW